MKLELKVADCSRFKNQWQRRKNTSCSWLRLL